MTQLIGRRCALDGEAEVGLLARGQDFRHPRYRREVFLRFYQFHLLHRAHPGCVYYLMPELARRFSWDMEQKLWFAFINGNTQNPVTSWLIFREFPWPPRVPQLARWFQQHYQKLAFDTDRRYHKAKFVEATARYLQLVQDSQEAYFERVSGGWGKSTFVRMWNVVDRQFLYFGRLSAFSYLEYLRVMGLPVECDTLFLSDRSGSRSHRNGLCRVLGRDDLDWHDSNPGFDGRYAPETIRWLESEAEILLHEARQRMPDYHDVGYFTLESTFCTYKGWHRPNRRYPNVYNDMLVDRIRQAEGAWGESLDLFWQIRADVLPPYLLLERNPADPGVQPRKQNHYLQTGQVIMMGHEWPELWSDFDEEVRQMQRAS